MFEFSVIRKYLIPQKKQLSVALIASMSVGVIALVVWLVLIFLSVTEGIEKNWLEKLTSLNAPLRINPTKPTTPLTTTWLTPFPLPRAIITKTSPKKP